MNKSAEGQPSLDRLIIQERRNLSPAILNLLSDKPLLLLDIRNRGVDQATFAQVSNHLKIRFDENITAMPVDDKGYFAVREVKLIEDENPLTLHPPSNFGARAGETIYEITVRPDMTLSELAILLRTIKRHVYENYHNKNKKYQDKNQYGGWFDSFTRQIRRVVFEDGVDEDDGLAELWFQSLARKRDEIMNTACALHLVRQEIRKESPVLTQFDQIPDFLFKLGQTLDLNDDYQGKTLDKIAQQKVGNDEEGLKRGLLYARFGKEEPRGRLKEAKTFDQAKQYYIQLYQKINQALLEGKQGRLIQTIIKNIAETALSKEADRSWTELSESAPSVLVMAGIERLYRELPLPTWVREFLAIHKNNQDKQLQYLQKNLEGWVFRVLAYELIGFYEYPPKTTRFAELDEKQQRLLVARLHEHLTTLGLGEENIKNFFEWFKSQGFSKKRKNLDRELAKAIKDKNKGKIQSILFEYSALQEQSLRKIIGQMRTYPGWIETNPMYALREAAPSNILREGGLNCVGRSLLLGKVLPQLGFSPNEIFYASSTGHSSLAVVFKDGNVGALVDPSTRKLFELWIIDNEQVNQIKKAMVDQGMALGIYIKNFSGGRYYSFFPFERGITADVLNNFILYISFIDDENIKKRYELTRLVAELVPSGHILQNWFWNFFHVHQRKSFGELKAELKEEDKQEVRMMLDKLLRAQPDIREFLDTYEKEGEFYSKQFYSFMRECFNQVGQNGTV